MKELYFFTDFNELASFLKVSTDDLWKLEICGDDYDYFVLAEAPFDDWYIERMLSGCCSNRTYNIVINKKEYIIGGAYHS